MELNAVSLHGPECDGKNIGLRELVRRATVCLDQLCEKIVWTIFLCSTSLLAIPAPQLFSNHAREESILEPQPKDMLGKWVQAKQVM